MENIDSNHPLEGKLTTQKERDHNRRALSLSNTFLTWSTFRAFQTALLMCQL